MHFIFLENSIDFTSSSLNLKAIDSFQKTLIHFSHELVKRNHKVTVFNNVSGNKTEEGVIWKSLSNITEEKNADVLIVFDDIRLLNISINTKIKFFFLRTQINLNDYKKTIINLIKNKFIILFNSDPLISELPYNFKYIPKIKLSIGISDYFFNNESFNLSKCNALVTVHPLRGLDWLLDLWVNLVSLKIPWAEMHIYSKILYNKNFVKNIKINNLKLKLLKYKNTGIRIMKPQIEKDFVKTLSNYRVHLNPSNDNNTLALSLLESQAKGIPVISKKNNDIYNHIYHNETGFITNNQNIFSQKIIDLLTDNNLFIRMSNNSKLNNKVNKWKDVIDKFEEKVYENIIHR